MPRFLARVQLEVRSIDATDPSGSVPAAWKLEKFDNHADQDLGTPLVVTARYRAGRDVTATDAVDAMSKVQTFVTNNTAALIPAGGRIARLRYEVEEWPT